VRDQPIALSTLRRLAWMALPVLASAGLVVELLDHLAPAKSLRPWVELFSLSYEENLPAWYASALLLTTALLTTGHAARARRYRRHWWFMAAALAYVSLDEVVQLHERLGDVFEGHGPLYFGWVIPAGVVVIVLAALYLPFLRDLPAATRRRFVIAAVVYVGGALLMELPLGLWTERFGDDSLGYALIDVVEETLELLGATLFLGALIDHREDHREEGAT